MVLLPAIEEVISLFLQIHSKQVFPIIISVSLLLMLRRQIKANDIPDKYKNTIICWHFPEGRDPLNEHILTYRNP